MPPSCALLGGFGIGARVALLWQHYGNVWQSPAVIRQAHRTPHACRTSTLRMLAKTCLAGDKIDAPAACAFPFRPYCGGVVTRTRNVSEYILVLTLCLVTSCDACPSTICIGLSGVAVICGHNAISMLMGKSAYCVKLCGEDCRRYSNKMESVALRKCPLDHYLLLRK